MNNPRPQLVLASSSPRRAQLLRQVGLGFVQRPVAVDERMAAGESPVALARRLAREKAEAGAHEDDLPVLGSDTVVSVDDEALGKPADEREALAMLARLSGRSHRVHTAVAVAHDGRVEDAVVTSEVTMRRIGAAEARAYWATGECVDKAGAYAIQGRGAVFVTRLDGSYSGVMGLPLFQTVELLGRAGVSVLDAWR